MEETDSSYDAEKIQERIASLGGGVAKIKASEASRTASYKGTST